MKQIIFSLAIALIILAAGWRTVSAESCNPIGSQSTPILGVYVLAYDNDPTITNTHNLASHATATLQSITAATAANPDAMAVILADLDQVGDTSLYVASNGTLTNIGCLPSEGGDLDAGLTEFDVTDGATLGGYLLWTHATFSAEQTVFSYIGHGSFFAPNTSPAISELIESAPNSRTLDPLPDRKNANPAYTDYHLPDEEGHRLITPYDLATAFGIANEAGAEPFDVIDLLHCFAGSAEEFYELREFGAYITGSPNYAFFDPTMPGTALGSLGAGGSAEAFAQTILLAYQSLIPPTDHPFISLAVESARLDDVKTTWDALSTELIGAFENDPAATANLLEAAYLNSFQYDTTFCDDPPELQLAPPDALSDMRHFATQISTQFQGSDVANRANDAILAMDSTLPFAQTFQQGSPWFYQAGGTPPVWAWAGGGEAFFSVFTPFQTWADGNGDEYHTWQALWYTTETSYEINGTTIDNPHPYAFIQRASSEFTWADVLARYWQERGTVPGVDVDTIFCPPPLRPLDPGFVEYEFTIDREPSAVQTGENVSYFIELENFGSTTMTQLAIIHTLSPSMTLQSAPAACELNAPTLVCPRPDLPVGEIDRYEIVVKMIAPGTVPFAGEVSMLQRGGGGSAEQFVRVTGVPLTITMSNSATSTSSLYPLLCILALLTVLVCKLSFPHMRKSLLASWTKRTGG